MDWFLYDNNLRHERVKYVLCHKFGNLDFPIKYGILFLSFSFLSALFFSLFHLHLYSFSGKGLSLNDFYRNVSYFLVILVKGIWLKAHDDQHFH